MDDQTRKAIKALTRRVEALEAALEAAPASPSRPEAVTQAASGTPGVFEPRPTCILCGVMKPAGRLELTCKPCGRERNAIIRGTSTKPRPAYAQCFNCGVSQTPSMKMLCALCGHAYKDWLHQTKQGAASTSRPDADLPDDLPDPTPEQVSSIVAWQAKAKVKYPQDAEHPKTEAHLMKWARQNGWKP